MKDSAEDFRLSYSGAVECGQGRALILAYDEKLDAFVLR
jgi:hypothetical protein